MTLKRFFQKAQKEKWALGQFNFSTLEQLKGIVLAAQTLKAPVILGTSQGEAKFFGLEEAVVLRKVLAEKFKAELFLHLDHGKDVSYIKKAIEAGYDSVHFDGSNLSFKENISLAKQVVKLAHKKHILVEGELGYISGSSQLSAKKVKIRQEDLTKPEQVKEFVAKTDVDSLAIAIGNIHGIHASRPRLDFERLREIRQSTSVFLVLHGGSGVANRDFKKAIKSGIQKININTDLRVAWRQELEASLKKSKTVKPYEVLPSVIGTIEAKVKKYLNLFKNYD